MRKIIEHILTSSFTWYKHISWGKTRDKCWNCRKKNWKKKLIGKIQFIWIKDEGRKGIALIPKYLLLLLYFYLCFPLPFFYDYPPWKMSLWRALSFLYLILVPSIPIHYTFRFVFSVCSVDFYYLNIYFLKQYIWELHKAAQIFMCTENLYLTCIYWKSL